MRMFSFGFDLLSLRLVIWIVFWRVVIGRWGNDVVFIIEMFGGFFMVVVDVVIVYFVYLFFFIGLI